MEIQPPNLTWDKDGTPYSVDFEDTYFSSENGLAESRYIFLQGNRLQQRWAQLKPGQAFTIVELGFGSGLNFMAAVQLWRQTAPVNCHLRFISIELHPMRNADLLAVQRQWPELTEIGNQLIDCYPELTPGYHRLNFDDQIEVTLIFDDAESALRSLVPSAFRPAYSERASLGHSWAVDAWFLDGFTPSRNPKCWSDLIFSHIRRLSDAGASVATFSCAGQVRRSLQAEGFRLEKLPGFGLKREMLRAEFEGLPSEQISARQLATGSEVSRFSQNCWHLPDTRVSPPSNSIAIIGGGIAGCSVASAFARRGVPVTLFERESPAAGASGNSQAALYARLSPDSGELEDFVLHALQFAQNYYRKLISRPDLGQLCGLAQLPRNASEEQKMLRVSARFREAPRFAEYKSARQLSDLAGVQLTSAGLWFAGSGWVNGPEVCRKLLDHPLIKTRYHTEISDYQKTGEGWSLLGTDRKLGSFTNLINCSAMDSRHHSVFKWLPIRPIRGQVSYVPDHLLRSTMGSESRPEVSSVICREHYFTPSHQGVHTVGATYHLDSVDQNLTDVDHRKNLSNLEQLLNLNLENCNEHLSGRAAIRCSTPDYLPLVGEAADVPRFLSTFEPWSRDKKIAITSPGPNLAGLYLNTGYGSRGFVYAPICAELLVSKILGLPACLPDYLIKALHPSRFLVRSIVRNRLADLGL